MTTQRFKMLEWMRWCLLRAAYEGGHLGITAEAAQHVVNYDSVWTMKEILDGLHYCIERELIKKESTPQITRFWLTRDGYDFVDGAINPQPGIARPPIEALGKK